MWAAALEQHWNSRAVEAQGVGDFEVGRWHHWCFKAWLSTSWRREPWLGKLQRCSCHTTEHDLNSEHVNLYLHMFFFLFSPIFLLLFNYSFLHSLHLFTILQPHPQLYYTVTYVLSKADPACPADPSDASYILLFSRTFCTLLGKEFKRFPTRNADRQSHQLVAWTDSRMAPAGEDYQPQWNIGKHWNNEWFFSNSLRSFHVILTHFPRWFWHFFFHHFTLGWVMTFCIPIGEQQW